MHLQLHFEVNLKITILPLLRQKKKTHLLDKAIQLIFEIRAGYKYHSAFSSHKAQNKVISTV